MYVLEYQVSLSVCLWKMSPKAYACVSCLFVSMLMYHVLEYIHVYHVSLCLCIMCLYVPVYHVCVCSCVSCLLVFVPVYLVSLCVS